MKNFFTNRIVKQGFFSLLILSLIFGSFLAYNRVMAAASITSATGGGAVSIDTTSSVGGTGDWTTLTGPTIAESAAGEIAQGTHTLTLPTGWEFNTNQDVTIGIAGDATQIVLTNGTSTPLAATLSFSVSSVSVTNPSTLTFSDIQVRPTGITPGTGNITYSGAGITGVSGATNFGTLTTISGAVTQLAITTQPTDTVYGSNISGVVVKTQDQFNNTSTSGLATTSSVTVVVASGDGTLTGSTTKDIGHGDGNGTLTFDDLKLDELGAHTLEAQHSTYTNDTSDSFNITAKPITADVTVNNKAYDGTTAGTISAAKPVGEVGSDDVTIVYSSSTVTFAQKIIDTGIVVDITGLTLGGAKAGLYSFTSGTATATADITQKALTVTAPEVTKVYDGTTTAVGTSTVGALASGDGVATIPTLTFDTKTASSSGKTVTPSGIVIKDGGGSGTDMTANYDITYVDNTTSSITKREITVTALTDSITYNASTTSSQIPDITSGDLASGDTAVFAQTFNTKTVGTGKTLTPEVTSIKDGSDADMTGNYDVTLANNETGVITAKELTVTGATVTEKTYDGETTAAITGATLLGVEVGDTVTLGNHEAGTFASKNIGTHVVTTTPMTISGDDAPNYSLTQPTLSGVITAREISITALTETKIYDGSVSSSKTPTLSSGTLASGDTAVYTQTFNSKSAGSKTLTPQALIKDAGEDDMTANYVITEVTESGTINQKTLTVTAPEVTKIYDGETTAVGTSTVGALASGDAVSTDPTLTFDTKNIGTNKTVTPSGIIIKDGGGSGVNMTANYNITYTPNTTSGITAKELTVTGATVTEKVYNGTNTAVISGATLSGKIGSEDVTLGDHEAGTFASKNIGTQSVTTTPMTISGADIGNYTLTQPTLSGTITAKGLTIGGEFTASNKIYDGGVVATGTTTSLTLTGKVEGDDLELNNIILNFADKTVANGKTVSINSAGLTGTDSGNYSLSLGGAPTTTANITAKELTLGGGFTTSNKIYDRTTSATLVGNSWTLDGVESEDVVTLNNPVIAFADKTVANGKTVSVTSMGIEGTDSGNYTLSLVGASTQTANITAKELTVEGITAGDKVYDTTVTATLDTDSAALVGIIAGDEGTVSIVKTGIAGTFNSADIGSGKIVTVTGVDKSGDDAGNYSITQPTTTASITAGSLHHFNVVVATTTTVGVSTNIMITAVDQYDNTISAANLVTPFTGQVFIETDAAAAIVHNNQTSFIAGHEGTKTLVGAITFNTVETGRSVSVFNQGATILGTTGAVINVVGTDTTPPAITEVSATTTQTTATITFTSDEAGSSKIGYGLSALHGNITSYASMTADDQNTATLTGLTCGTTYHYTAYGKDAVGNEDNTTDATFGTLACTPSDTTPPAITGVSATTTQTTANISFKSDENGFAYLSHSDGVFTPISTGLIDVVGDVTGTISLAGLTCGVTYDYILYVGDNSINVSYATGTFETLACDTVDSVAPVISEVSATTTQTTATISFESNESGLARLSYYTGSVTPITTDYISVSSATEAEISLAGLACGTTYNYTLYAKDASSNEASATSTFATLACDAVTSPSVISVEKIQKDFLPDNSYANGWEWRLLVTLPDDENGFAIKFADWVSGSNTLATASNVRYYLEQVGVGGAETITTANTYPDDYITVISDDDVLSGTPGVQVYVIVQVKVPSATPAGSYSTSYQIETDTIAD